MNSDDEIYGAFGPLWMDMQGPDTFPAARPLLAHYTSIATLESIMTNNELWFSNPLYMNDLEELRFGILEGADAFRRSEAIKLACGNPERHEKLLDEFACQLDRFSNQHALDTYVFCLTEHEKDNTDGLLSMWRGYGGGGNGAAIIFDTERINYVVDAPLIFSKVTYQSRDERQQLIGNKLAEFARLLSGTDIPTDKLYLASHAIFERIKIFSIFTKHCGFSEEREWRVAYLRERDRNHVFDKMLHYAIGKQGVEPKLKLKIEPIAGVSADDLSLEKIVCQIVLGPSVSSPLAKSVVRRMLETIGKQVLADKLVTSTTPFRAA